MQEINTTKRPPNSRGNAQSELMEFLPRIANACTQMVYVENLIEIGRFISEEISEMDDGDQRKRNLINNLEGLFVAVGKFHSLALSEIMDVESDIRVGRLA